MRGVNANVGRGGARATETKSKERLAIMFILYARVIDRFPHSGRFVFWFTSYLLDVISPHS